MKYISEYRNADLVRRLAERIAARVVRPYRIMEICGGQTHSIMKYNLSELLPEEITLIHGPGCPVCVTPLEKIDRALALAARNDIILSTYGDMMRVPGSSSDLLRARSEGADVRVVYSPLDSLAIAVDNPDKTIVFFAIGFETTAPANALALLRAAEMRLPNFCMISSHVLVPPAIRALLASGDSRIDGLLAPGHVCTVTGFREYETIAHDYKLPVAVTGFEPVDILRGIEATVDMLNEERFEVENRYERSVNAGGNPGALKTMYQAFEVCDRKWRGIGKIPASGLAIREEYSYYDAERRFDLESINTSEPEVCIAGLILQGLSTPDSCPAFGTLCTPEKPLGAPMVSSEGACAAYYRYKSFN
ncbi:MAG: hydrogenase formation protein HypD [Bacteroidales bacterium]|nr:hydrogenase formation protein HypD [Bacteroidales bacterium]